MFFLTRNRSRPRLKLLAIYRIQVQQYKQQKRDEIDRQLLQWITMWGRRIFANPAPSIGMAIFLGRKRKTGKRAKNIDRIGRHVGSYLC